MCPIRHELDGPTARAAAPQRDRHGAVGTGARGVARGHPRDPRASLTGPSRTITVEPIVVPRPDPAPAPARREEPAEPRPSERPAEEPVPAP